MKLKLFFIVVFFAFAQAQKTNQALTLLAAGDIAMCDQDGDEQTEKMLASMKGQLLTLGDNVYPRGSSKYYKACYAPTWGKELWRTHAVMGNHDFDKEGKGNDYFKYFGVRAGTNPFGYYAYSLGAWKMIVLNSNCWFAGCNKNGAQYKWLEAELKKSPACTLVAFHHPRFSSGLHGSNEFMQDIWALLANTGVDVVLSGHDHHYERFEPKDAAGNLSSGGARQFVVGTGGAKMYPAVFARAGSQTKITGKFGILELQLLPNSYAWKFISTTNSKPLDAGEANCH